MLLFGFLSLVITSAAGQFKGGTGDGFASVVSSIAIVGITDMYKGGVGDGFTKVNVAGQPLGFTSATGRSSIIDATILDIEQEISQELVMYAYPNPSSYQFRLFTREDVTIVLYDIFGKPVLSQAVIKGLPVNTEGLLSGSYYIRVYNKETVQTIKLLIAH